VVILDVVDTNLGSEISDLLMDRLRFAGTFPWLWDPVGVFAPDDPTGEGCGKDGLAVADKGVGSPGLGERSIMSV